MLATEVTLGADANCHIASPGMTSFLSLNLVKKIALYTKGEISSKDLEMSLSKFSSLQKKCSVLVLQLLCVYKALTCSTYS